MSKVAKKYFVICVIFTIFSGLLAGLAGSVLLMVSLGFCFLSDRYHPSHLDWVVTVVSCFSFIAAVCSPNVALSIINVVPIEMGILVYFTIRTQRSIFVLLAPLVLCNLLSILAIISFYDRYRRWLLLGFSDLSPFRHQVSTVIPWLHLGNPIGMYIAAPAYSLCLLYQVREQNRPLLLMSSSLPLLVAILSFSRAAYLALTLSLFLGLSTLIYFIRKSRAILFAGFGSILFIFSVVISWKLLPFVFRTLLLTQSSTQTRSLHGRVEIFKEVIHSALHSGFLGTGPGSALLIDHPSLPQAFNSLLQIWIQFGYAGLGITLYGMVVLLVAIRRLSTISLAFSLAVLGFAVAIFAYNSFWSDLLLDDRSLYFAFLLVALIANAEENLLFSDPLSRRRLVVSAADGRYCQITNGCGNPRTP